MAEYPERSWKAESEPKPRMISPLAPTRPLAAGPGLGGHQGRVDPAVLEDPGFLLGRAAGHHVEGVGALEHLDVVDGPDGFGVGQLGESDPHPPMVLLTCENQGSGGSSPQALAIIDPSRKVAAAPP